MTQRKIALSIEEAADYTGIGRNTLRKLVEWKKLPVSEGWGKTPDQNGYAGTFYGSQRGQGLEG